MNRLASLLIAGTALIAGLQPAWANIAESEAHHRAMMDIAATPPWVEEEVYDDEDYYGYDEGPAYSQQEWVDWTAEVARLEAEREAEKLNDPKYRAFVNGQWLHKSPTPGGADQTCSALFMRKGVGAMVVALGGKSETALLVFFGPDIPAPAATETIKVSLTQTGDAPASVNVFNTALPWASGFGMVVFAVPSADAALAGMTDTLAFSIAIDGKPPTGIEWTGGLAARDKLSTCVAGRS